MNFDAKIIEEESFDPFFKVKFTYETDSITVQSGFAEVVRQGLKPVIKYGPETREKLKNADRSKLELELLNVIVGFLFSNGSSRTFKGNLMLYSA